MQRGMVGELFVFSERCHGYRWPCLQCDTVGELFVLSDRALIAMVTGDPEWSMGV